MTGVEFSPFSLGFRVVNFWIWIFLHDRSRQNGPLNDLMLKPPVTVTRDKGARGDLKRRQEREKRVAAVRSLHLGRERVCSYLRIPIHPPHLPSTALLNKRP